MNKKLLWWELGSLLFLSTIGASLHYVFELSGFERSIAWLGAVNESTWEHLKMAFWPVVVYALIEYSYVRKEANNFVVAKALSLIVMMSIIIAAWYIYTPIFGNINWLNIALFYVAVIIGTIISYRLLRAEPWNTQLQPYAFASLVLLVSAFTVFTYYPPRFSLFEHFDLQDTGEYGILDDYSDILIFTSPAEE